MSDQLQAVADRLMYTITVDAQGTCMYRDHRNMIHRLNGPAIITVDGQRYWYQNNQLHRTDGPAVEWTNDRYYWYLNGKQLTHTQFLHRQVNMPHE